MENAFLKSVCFEGGQTRVETETLLVTRCVIQGTFLTLSVSVSLSLKGNDHNSTYAAVRFK